MPGGGAVPGRRVGERHPGRKRRPSLSCAFADRVAEEMISTIAVGTDGSETARKAVDVGAEMARRFDARLVLLSAYDESPAASSGNVDEQEWAWNPVARLREILARTERELNENGIDCVTRTGKGNPAKTLVELAEK